jgi:[glutamine synthetase] adenylyltransferase / [glutamine synthetase]-adenylyl-L-tyrosine phosphorylase
MTVVSARSILHCGKPPFPAFRDRTAAMRLLENVPVELASEFAHHGDFLAGVCEGSPYLSELIKRDFAFASRCVNHDPEQVFADVYAACLNAAVLGNVDTLFRVLRQQKCRFALLAGLCDLSNTWSLAESLQAITRFADVAVAAIVRALLQDAERQGRVRLDNGNCGYVVLAMGKHGAGELNYSSDIDLVVLFDTDAAERCGIAEPQGFFVKLTRRLVAMLQDVTEDGYVFRCDLRLRPDPRATQVAIAMEAAATYYENQGQNWERAAFIKARAVAGDIALGEDFLKRLQPYIWRKYLDFAAIADVQSLIRQIHATKGHGEIAVEGHNIKLGRGGIREIEFFVQTQQLIAGGRNPALRGRETLAMLQALAKAKWISLEAANDLSDAYIFLRRIEHRIQMQNDQQSHEVPSRPESFAIFARFCGFDAAEAFRSKLRNTLETVRNHSARLFEKSESLGSGEGSLVFTGGEDDPATNATLNEMGFARASEISATVRGWHFGRYNATRDGRAKEALTEIMPRLLVALARNGNADQTFFDFDRFLQGLPAGVQLFSMLRAQPALLDLLAQILGTAPKLAEGLSRQPRILEAVLDPGFYGPLPSMAELAAILHQMTPDDLALEEVMDRARVFAREHKFRVGVRILSETVTAEAAGQGFANIADTILRRLLDAVLHDMQRAHGTIKDGEVALIALGKLGGCEMTSASDLDLILVYDHPDGDDISSGPRPLSAGQYYARFTQRLVTALSAPTAEGLLYDVDMRLRPSGSKGPVAVTYQAFAGYHHTEAWTWERMALTRARVVCGSARLTERLNTVIRHELAADRDSGTLRKDATDMRQLMLNEHQPAGPWDIKRVRGGLVEVEFMAQVLQLQHAHTAPDVLDTNTLNALTKLSAQGFLPQKVFDQLRKACHFYQRLTQILRLCLEGDFDPDLDQPGLRRTLCIAVALPDIGLVELQLREFQAAVAGLFDQWIGNPQ